MGTAMRFFVVLAGLGFMVFAFAMIGPSLYDVLTDFFDEPWGNAAVLLMLAVVAAAPFYIGVRLVRKGLRDEAPRASVESTAQDVAIETVESRAPTVAETVPATSPSVASPMIHPADGVAAPVVRRPKLAYAGLALALVGLLLELNIALFVLLRPPPNAGEWFGTAVFAVLASGPLLLGLWLARLGDPEIGCGLLSDLGLRLSDLRRPARWLALLSTSYGLAIATYLVAAPLMLIWRAQSAEIGIAALMLYSLFDPALNLTRPSWWTGAMVSFGVGMALFFALLLTAGILRRLGDDQYNFMYPLLLYIPAMGLLGLVRFFDNLRRSD